MASASRSVRYSRRRGARGGRPPARARCVRRAEGGPQERRRLRVGARAPPRRRRRTWRRIAAGSSAPSAGGQHRGVGRLGEPLQGVEHPAVQRRLAAGRDRAGERRAAQVVAEGHPAAWATSPASASTRSGDPYAQDGQQPVGDRLRSARQQVEDATGLLVEAGCAGEDRVAHGQLATLVVEHLGDVERACRRSAGGATPRRAWSAISSRTASTLAAPARRTGRPASGPRRRAAPAAGDRHRPRHARTVPRRATT